MHNKFLNLMVKGYKLYFTAHCINEPLHIHASDKQLTETGSLKLWMDMHGNTIIAHQLHNIPDHIVTRIRRTVKLNRILIIEKWESYTGKKNDFHTKIFLEIEVKR